MALAWIDAKDPGVLTFSKSKNSLLIGNFNATDQLSFEPV